MADREYLGFGLGLRSDHYNTILETTPNNVDWFEAITEDYMIDGGNPLHFLRSVREKYPVVLHGVSMSLGSMDPLDGDYLKRLKTLLDDIQPPWFSDHLCWTGVNGKNLHDLMPLPYTEEALNHVVSKISQVQEYVGRQMLIENVSSYITYEADEMSEWEFVSEVLKRADCLMLMDVNNIYVSGFNHDFDPKTYIDAIPVERVQQFHMAGHTNLETHIIDTHDDSIIDEVWDLYRYAAKHVGKVSVMIERDGNIPELPELLDELAQARNIGESVWLQQDEVVEA